MRRFVTDTHALLWHFMRNRKLSRKARQIFQAADSGIVQILVPSIVLIEVVYIFARNNIPQEILERVFALTEEIEANYCVVPLNMKVAYAFREFGPAAIPEMPDRIIATTARSLNAPLPPLTRPSARASWWKLYGEMASQPGGGTPQIQPSLLRKGSP